MSRPMKVLVYLVVAVLVGAMVTGVAYWTAEDETPDEPGLYINGKQVETPDVMLTVGAYSFSFDEYRHYFLIERDLLESYYSSYGGINWDDPDGNALWALHKAVETELVNLAVWMQIAEEEGITLTEEDHAEIATTLADQKEQHGDDFDQYLADMYLPDEETYVRITEWQTLSDKAQAAYLEKLEAELPASLATDADAEFRDTHITAKHILIMADSEAEDTEQAKTDAYARAEEILTDILAEAAFNSTVADPETDDAEAADGDEDAQGAEGEDAEDTEPEETPAGSGAAVSYSEALLAAFDEAMHEYSEDTGLSSNPDGYTFTEGEMVDIFYETAMALPEYEVSEPVWSDTSSNYSGWHIILRLPLSETALEENRASVTSTEVTRLKDEKVEAVKAGLDIVGGPYYGELKQDSIR